MKRITTLAAFAIMFIISTNAQTVYDAAKIANKDLSGTARFVGMGGAMGALGGDISTMGTNPAGIGIYRSNDIMTTVNFATMGTNSKYGGNSYSSDADKFMFNNLGVVLSTQIGNHTSLRYVNFGFNYSRTKSFYKNMSMSGLINTGPSGELLSQVNQMSKQANGHRENLMANNVFTNNRAGWLGALGAQGNLLELLSNDEYDPYIVTDRPYADFYSHEKGGVHQYDFNVSFNFNDRVYLGATIGAYDVDYRKYSNYYEGYDDFDERYVLQSWNKIDGTGVDFKLGAIVRPFEDSPLRIGFAVHTPTFYNLKLGTSARLESDVWLPKEGTNIEELYLTDVDTYDILRGDMNRDFKLRTPWLINTSLGYTVGSTLALGAEYEFENYSTMKFRYPEGDEMSWETSTANNMLKSVHTVRLGLEYKPIPEFAFRAGYNFSSALFKDDSYKALWYNSINTDTDFANSKAMSNYTLGIGYRGNFLYADLAYKYNHYKEDFYPFEEIYLNPTKVTNNNHQVFITLGCRF